MIRAKDILETLKGLFRLNEENRTILNFEELRQFLALQLSIVQKKRISADATRWINSQLKSYLMNRYQNVTLLDPRRDRLTDYVSRPNNQSQTDYETGRPVYYIHLNEPHLKEELTIIYDYLWLSNQAKRPESIAYEDMVIKALTWKKTFNDSEKMSPNDGVEEVGRIHSIKVVRLLTKEALDLEGIRMHNCINGHDYREGEIYSIRTSDDKPLCSVYMIGGELQELSGRHNDEVRGNFQEICQEIINDILKMRSASEIGKQSAYLVGAAVEWDERERRFKLVPKEYNPYSGRVPFDDTDQMIGRYRE
jgi:hypothetical protein